MKKTEKLSLVVFTLWMMLLFFGWYLYLKYNIGIEALIFGAKQYMLENKLVGICIFIVLYSIRPLFFVLAGIFDMFAGMIFGPVFGFFLAWIATFFSCMFSYGVGKVIGAEFIEKKQWKRLERLKKKLQKDTFHNALMMRLLLLPYDLGNYLAGILKIPFWKYVSGTSLGILPATFVFVSAGSAFYGQDITDYQSMLENIQYENLWFASGFFATILLVAKLLKKRQKNITL